MNIPELLRDGAASTRMLAELQRDSNHIKDAERMEAVADELDAENSLQASCLSTGYNYVDVVGKGCEGWLNLFFGDFCIALVDNVNLANEIRLVTKKRSE